MTDIRRTVNDFGAVGDGVTDDTAAVQAAIEDRHLAGGGRVVIPAGGRSEEVGCISGVVLSDVRIEIDRWSGKPGGFWDLQPHPARARIAHATSGIHLERLNDVRPSHCDVVWSQEPQLRAADLDQALAVVDVEDLQVTDFRAESARPHPLPVRSMPRGVSMTVTAIPPANPRATSQARDLLETIGVASGQWLFSGQHNAPRHISSWSERAEQITGHYPAVWGQDFGFASDGDHDGINFRPAVIAEAKRQHATGSIITLMWHAVRPTGEEPATFDDNICNGPLADQDWIDLLTPGTATHARWERQVDVIAELLAELRDADIPVLWRPYHEMNGEWFWWGSRPGAGGYEALYRQLYQRFVSEHRLDNLLWVWNANAPRTNPGDSAGAYADFYPGHDVVDILAADVYANDYAQSRHDQLVQLGDGRPIALGEVGELPTREILAEQPRWTWFMTWNAFLTDGNTEDAVRALYADPRVHHRPTLKTPGDSSRSVGGARRGQRSHPPSWSGRENGVDRS